MIKLYLQTLKFFIKTYTQKYTQDNLLNNIKKQIPNTNKTKLEQHLTSDELLEALKQMKDDKSPGLDGIPKEFYNTFWDTIKNDITYLYNYILFNKKELSNTQKLVIITLIPKKDDLTEIKNWRPISLLNCDYKIFHAPAFQQKGINRLINIYQIWKPKL